MIMDMDEHARACLRAILDGKQMQQLTHTGIGVGYVDINYDTALHSLAYASSRANVRIKPQLMCELAGVQYPMPMTEVLNYGNDYYVASPQGVDQHTWRNDDEDVEWLALHICHTTFEAAEAHSKAMLAVNAQAVAKAKEQA